MSEFDTGLPSIRQIQGFIKQGKQLEIKLLTNDLFTGQLLWQDQHSLYLIDQDGQQMIIWRHAIAYLKILDGGEVTSRALQAL
ncbi:MAG: RNA-binding protein hfq [Potamolinea sp.]